MRVPYTAGNGAGPTYEIETDRHGSYTVMLGGKVVKRVTALSNYLGRPKWGSRQLEAQAVKDAMAWIEAAEAQGQQQPMVRLAAQPT